jgi:predicted cupin superfamily sugar epimerase
MKSVDHRLREDAKAFAQRQRQLARKTAAPKPTQATKKAKKQRAKTYILDDDNDNEATDHEDIENGFHFIAYIPAQNHLWRMDGLQREPESLGILSDKGNWLDMAVAELSAQWQSAAENNIEFSLLSLVAASEDDAARAEENVKASRMREDWGPALVELVRIVAER